MCEFYNILKKAQQACIFNPMSTRTLRFTKMHGAGNDFIVLDGIHQDLTGISKAEWVRLAHRQLGIGADQILLVERPSREGAEFKYRIINADGNEVEQCGNGSRCFVRFVREKGLTQNTTVKVEVTHTILSLTENSDRQVTVNMGPPILTEEQIPFAKMNHPSKQEGQAKLYQLQTSEGSFWIHPVSMGNPHGVQIVSDVEHHPVATQGPALETHPTFPKKMNAGFMQIISSHEIKLRVFERGSGETLACGTGACAAVVSGVMQNKLISPVTVHTRGGDLIIEWDGNPEHPVMMTGPAVTVFEGEVTF